MLRGAAAVALMPKLNDRIILIANYDGEVTSGGWFNTLEDMTELPSRVPVYLVPKGQVPELDVPIPEYADKVGRAELEFHGTKLFAHVRLDQAVDTTSQNLLAAGTCVFEWDEERQAYRRTQFVIQELYISDVANSDGRIPTSWS